MQHAIDQFRISVNRVKNLIALHNSVKVQSTSALDLSDMLRAGLVLTVSALDYYIHEVVTLGMVDIHQGNRPEPSPKKMLLNQPFLVFKCPLGAHARNV